MAANKSTALIGGVLTSLLMAIFPSLSAAQGSLPKVVITYPSRSIVSIDLLLAQERGFFREEGLDTQLVQVRGMSPSLPP